MSRAEAERRLRGAERAVETLRAAERAIPAEEETSTTDHGGDGREPRARRRERRVLARRRRAAARELWAAEWEVARYNAAPEPPGRGGKATARKKTTRKKRRAAHRKRMAAERSERLAAERSERLAAEHRERTAAEHRQRVAAERLERLAAERLERMAAECRALVQDLEAADQERDDAMRDVFAARGEREGWRLWGWWAAKREVEAADQEWSAAIKEFHNTERLLGELLDDAPESVRRLVPPRQDYKDNEEFWSRYWSSD